MEAMKKCQVELTSGGKAFAEVKIQIGIFQRGMHFHHYCL